MKKLITILLVILPMFIMAQTNYEDVVYLKNGSIIHGVIIEQIPNQTIKIKTKDNNVFVFKIEEVEKITKEQNIKTNSDFVNNIKKKGYASIIEIHNDELGWVNLLDKHERTFSNTNAAYGISYTGSYIFNSNISLGIGTGISYYYLYDINEYSAIIPIFADIRINFINKRCTPYFATQIGYSFLAGQTNYQGGAMINPSFGVKFYITPKTAINFSIGFLYQIYKDNYNFTGDSFGNNTINAKIGISF